MNVQELLTYVEELAFKTSMFGYDKDEVDIQLDKICDEIETLVQEKDKEIAALKGGKPYSKAEEEETEEKDPVVVDVSFADDEDGLKQQLSDTLERLERAESRAQAAEDRAEAAEERAEIIAEQLEEAEEKITAAEERTKEAEQALEAAKAQGQTEDAAPEMEAVQAEAAPAPDSADAAYQQYLRNADLLCKQLADLQTKQDSITASAKEEANTIIDEAKTQAEHIIADANAQAIGINQEAEVHLKEAEAREQEIHENYTAKCEEEQKRCEELTAQKNVLAESLGSLTKDIQALIEKVNA